MGCDKVDLKPSRRKDLKESSINIFTGKPSRLIKAVHLGGTLWDESNNIKYIFSVGGSLGPLRVADGTWDASIEYAKGFRPWDFGPGAFIAEGAGACVMDNKGNEIKFGPIPKMKEYLREGFRKEALEECRQKFIVAGTKELASCISNKINQEADFVKNGKKNDK
jgi:fructose-1,6-bisphosphatase/inositol monophosphatase family enzyme